MADTKYTPAQLDLLLFQGKQACIKVGYSPEFVDRAYQQITDLIESSATGQEAPLSGIEDEEIDEILDQLEDENQWQRLYDDDAVILVKELVRDALGDDVANLPFGSIELSEALEDLLDSFGNDLEASAPGECEEDTPVLQSQLKAIARVMTLNRQALFHNFAQSAAGILNGLDAAADGLEDFARVMGQSDVD